MDAIVILIGLFILALILVWLPYRKCSCQTRAKAKSIFHKKEKHDER